MSAQEEAGLPVSSGPMPTLSISNAKTIEKCCNFPLRETDIFICSYPKSGTTWLQHIVLTLILIDNNNKSDLKQNEATSSQDPLLSLLSIPSEYLPPPIYQHVSDFAPFFEIDTHWEVNTTSNVPRIRSNHERIGRRIFNTHLRFDMLPSSMEDSCSSKFKTGGGKFIYIVRSPLDACVSFYAHLSNQVEDGYEKCLEEFCTDWMNGKIAYGTWDDHILSYMIAFSFGTTRKVILEDGREFLLVRYQDMIENVSKVVDELINFLQFDAVAQHKESMLRLFSFDYMRKHIDHFQPKSVTWKNQFKFLRGGQSGDGRRIISATKQVEFDRYLRERNVANRLSKLLTIKKANYEVYHMMALFVHSEDRCTTAVR